MPDTHPALRAWAIALVKIARGDLAQLTTTERAAVMRYDGAPLLRPRATPLQRKTIPASDLHYTKPQPLRVKR